MPIARSNSDWAHRSGAAAGMVLLRWRLLLRWQRLLQLLYVPTTGRMPTLYEISEWAVWRFRNIFWIIVKLLACVRIW